MTWNIEIENIDLKKLQYEESLFTLGNGYLGIRGNLEEISNDIIKKHKIASIRGTYINAFYDDVKIPYAEKSFGYPETSQKMLNLIDTQTIKIYLGDELISPFTGEIVSTKRILYLKKGYAERIMHYKSPKGKEVLLTFKRLVSFKYKELFSQEVIISPINYYGEVVIISTINGDVENHVDKSDPRLSHNHSKCLHLKSHQIYKDYAYMLSQTESSHLKVAVFSETSVNCKNKKEISFNNNEIITKISFNLSSLTKVSKRNMYFDSLRYGEDLIKNTLLKFIEARKITFSELIEFQTKYLQLYYNNCDIEIKGNEHLQLGIRFNLFHLLQSVGKDKYSNISAKGLSGEGYEGHYFWDTEIFIFPVFLLTNPNIAKNLLLYRYNTLDLAKKRARELGHSKGISYPWRTIKGTECSSYFPASSAQYHINADISYSCILYFLVTNDLEFMLKYGAEIVFESARLFIDLGHYNKNGFNIFGITGPDEYTAIVNNNYYTNVMVKYNFKWAVKLYNILKQYNNEFKQLTNKIGLTFAEIKEFEKAEKEMYLPYNKKLNIIPQDDSFLDKPMWDLANTPKEKFPLLLHYHLLKIYRHQVCKQADTVLAHFLLEDEVDIDILKNTYHYYEKITTHDSSLSSCIFSIMAMKIGEVEKAYDYFIDTARMDLDNTHKNTKDGLHMANMGGTYMAIVFGFAGLRIKENKLSFEPKIPREVESYKFKIKYKGRIISVYVNQDSYNIELKEGKEIKIFINSKELILGNKIKTIESK